jgi:class 3 adenylate cyclase
VAERAVERRVVSVLFADLVGFTTLSERLDAEDVALVQDAYFAAARETIERHRGVLEKFVGDAVMAVFGAVRARDDDAERAVRAGLALIAAVERLNGALELDDETLRLRVGVNTGEAVVGEASAERGPVTGDTVNVAARLQTAAEPGSLVAGEVTALAVADVAELERLPPLELKGKAEVFRAARVVALHPERSRERALGDMRAPTLGREAELEQLARSLGSTAAILVAAPPGVGKSRLVSEFAARAAGSGIAVLIARLRPDLLSPFEAVAQLLEAGGGRAALARGDDARAAVVAELLAAAIEPRPGMHAERAQLFGAWVEGLDGLADDAPAVWIVEDVHWASADLLSFLTFAGGVERPAGRVIVATTRPALLGGDVPWLESVELLELQPMATADASSLVGSLVGDALPAELVEQLVERSGGNALFIEELLRMWASAGVLTLAADGWELTTHAGDVPLPPTVQAIYAGQLDDLPDDARSAVRRAAVAGRRFPIAALPVLDVATPDAAVDALMRRGLVAGPKRDPLLGESYVYRHALLRDAGYASLARAERARLHVRLADWLASLDSGALAEVIARHYAAALDSAPQLMRELEGRTVEDVRNAAAAWFERATGGAIAVAAWETAAILAARSLELTGDDAHARARRLQALGEATASAVGVDQALPHLHEALSGFRGLGAREEIGAAGWVIGQLLRAQTLFERAERLADELLAELGEPDDAAVARLLVLRSVAALNARDDFTGAHADATRALAIARAVADGDLELEATQLLAQIQDERGGGNPGVWDALARIGRERGRFDVVAAALRNRAAFDWDDNPRASLPVIDEAAEVARVYGLVEATGWAGYSRTEAHLSSGDWDSALTAGLDAVDFAEARNLYRVVVRSWFTVRPIAVARGRSDLLERAFDRFAARRGVEPDSPYARIVTTAMHLSFADAGLEPPFVPGVAERLQSFELDQATPSWLAGVETIIDAWLAAGDLDGAEAALERMRASVTLRSSTKLAIATESLLRARLLMRRGRDEEAQHAARAALVTEAPWWRAKVYRLLGDPKADEIERELGIPAH